MRWLALGLLLALAGVGHDHRALLSPPGGDRGPPAWWVADRGGDRLLALDGGLFPSRVLELRAPLALAPSTRGLWVVSAAEGTPRGRHRVLLLGPEGDPRVDLVLPPVRAAEPLAGGALALLVGSGPDTHLMWVGPDAHLRRVVQLPDALALATDGEGLLVANAGGELWSLPDPGLPRAGRRRWLDLRPMALAPGPRGGWWVLGEGGRLLLLDQGLAVQLERELPLGNPRLARGGDGSGALWVVDGARGQALRVESDGGDGARAQKLPAAGLEGGWATADGGLLAVAAGALLRLDAGGDLVRAQGGLTFAVAVAPATVRTR